MAAGDAGRMDSGEGFAGYAEGDFSGLVGEAGGGWEWLISYYGSRTRGHTPGAKAQVWWWSERPKAEALEYLEAKTSIRQTRLKPSFGAGVEDQGDPRLKLWATSLGEPGACCGDSLDIASIGQR